MDRGITIFPADNLKWQDGPACLPKGCQIALLEGDPTREGPFVFRLKLPDGYRIPAHTHPKTERVTVLAGQFNVSMVDAHGVAAPKEMRPGTFGHWPPGMKHTVSTTGPTILQFHGQGPWSIDYVNPDDDPRK